MGSPRVRMAPFLGKEEYSIIWRSAVEILCFDQLMKFSFVKMLMSFLVSSLPTLKGKKQKFHLSV